MKNILSFKNLLNDYLKSDFQCLCDEKAIVEKEAALEDLVGLKNCEDNIIGKYNHLKDSYTDNELSMNALNTSFADWYVLLKHINHDETLIDLGSGYSKGSILSALYENVANVESYEYILERVNSSKKALRSLELSDKTIHHQNLLTNFPEGKNYFMYLPASVFTEKMLTHLFEIACKHQICLYAVESHGDFINLLKSKKWLNLKEKLSLKTPRHDPSIYIFNSLDPKECLSILKETHNKNEQTLTNLKNKSETVMCSINNFYSLQEISKADDQIVFEDERGQWIGDFKESSLCFLDHKKPHIELQYPKRRIPFTKAIKILRPNEELTKTIRLRRENPNFRKIYIYPHFFIETI
ncbi:hypothetical protein [Bacteriovorax sp. BSW11_IV]|uniref:hypothetical protein n=1 Tax=Bacteriovorax sp. BSW11_IV TaxID=1353529 RepID=UPI000551813A|nr:hypothetical protein [Bacteriovorax sp. BSW11_IV]